MKVWRNYDQAALDAQFGTRSQLGDRFDAWTEECSRASAAVRARLTPRLDVAYGPGPRQVLDIFPAADGQWPAPIAVYVHGGFWRMRDKSEYSFLANGLRSLGAAPIFVNYPLCPTANLDEIVGAVRQAVRWLLDHATEFGGDPRRLWMIGHSAGAHLVAMCCVGDGAARGELPTGTVKGALLSSGLYDLEPVQYCFANADIGLDADQVARLSPTRLRPSLEGPLLVAVGAMESDEFHRQTRVFTEAMRLQGATADALIVPAANHYGMVQQLAEPKSLLLSRFRALLSLPIADHRLGGSYS